ncbi:G protein-coupled receptor, putative, partial [Ixodes scapularis]
VYGSTLLLGLVGNLLIVYTVARFQRMRSISNIFLASLATADLLIVLLCIPVKVITFRRKDNVVWSVKYASIYVIISFLNPASSAKSFARCGVRRYYAVIHPVRSRYLCTFSQARRVIIFIWISSSLSALPIIFVQAHVEMGLRRTAYWCMRDEENPTRWRSFEIYMLVLVLCIPTIVMGYAYTRICVQLWMVNQGEVSFAHSNYDAFFVIKMLILVVALFVICWAPILILNVLTAFGGVKTLNYSYLKPLRTTFHLMSYLNSCVNPLVYGFMSKSFRGSFRDALLGCLRPRRSGVASRGNT